MADDRTRPADGASAMVDYIEPDSLNPFPAPPETAETTAEAALPEVWGVLYAGPNPDGSRKACGNCMMWALTQQCAIHDPDLIIEAEHICGYHVFGPPMETMPDHPGIMPVNPDESGLEMIPGGTSCDTCVYYAAVDEQVGDCHAVVTPDGEYAPVHSKGCCARWDDGMEAELPHEEPHESPPGELPPSKPESEPNPGY